MIRPAADEDLDAILDVLACYNFRVLSAVDRAPVDPGFEGELSLYNEVSEIRLDNAFVAVHEDDIVGFCHFKPGSDSVARTTLISVRPGYSAGNYGRQLQEARMRRAHQQGFTRMLTHCDNKRACLWYQRHFGYRITGRDVNRHRLHFITAGERTVWGVHYGFYENPTVAVLETDLERYFQDR